MAGDRLSGFSSAFDEVLAQNRRQLDELLSKSQSASGAAPQRGADATRSTSARHQAPQARQATEPHASAGAHRFDADASAAVQRLQARFGSDWRYDVVEQFREADECIVRCRITIPSSGVNKTQFGSARVGGGAARISGAADGVSFSLQLGDAPVAQSAQAAEQAAFQQAVESALTRCEEML